MGNRIPRCRMSKHLMKEFAFILLVLALSFSKTTPQESDDFDPASVEADIQPPPIWGGVHKESDVHSSDDGHVSDELPGGDHDNNVNDDEAVQSSEDASADECSLLGPAEEIDHIDEVEDSFFDPIAKDHSCDGEEEADCWAPPDSTIETEVDMIDASCINPEICDSPGDDQASESIVDKHWGSDPNILAMRDKLRDAGSGASQKHGKTFNQRPPVFLLPGLASTRLVAWKFKKCALSDIKVQDNVWLNINLLLQMGTLDVACMTDCLKLGLNQSDTDDLKVGCKLRPDEGLDAISSLSPGGIGSSVLIGGTNTVYAWLIQWLADNLGYDVSNIIGLPYDWRLSPDKMEERDGFFTLTRRRIEAAVKTNGKPGIVLAHSMGNTVFRYFLEWLRHEMRLESYEGYVQRAQRRAKNLQKGGPGQKDESVSYFSGWMSGAASDFDEWWHSYFAPEEDSEEDSDTSNGENDRRRRHPKFWQLAKIEGDSMWTEWLEKHIWTYVGLSAPMLGAVNPLRSVISGENMGMPMTDEVAREIELSFGSTHTINPMSSKSGFCDNWDGDRWDEETIASEKNPVNTKLACLDEISVDIESSDLRDDPWKDFKTLKRLLKDRLDWDTDFPMIDVNIEECQAKGKPPCTVNSTLMLGPCDAETGELFTTLSKVWKEAGEPLVVKREQLEESFWESEVPNILNQTWERPLIKHIIMAYGVDIPTEVGYTYRKVISKESYKHPSKFDEKPNLDVVTWEEPTGKLTLERLDNSRGGLADILVKKRKREPLKDGSLPFSGDGSVPYLSLAWAHTWLLHAVRAMRHSGEEYGNPLEEISVSHRPLGAMEWVEGLPSKITGFGDRKRKEEELDDTGTLHPHGTKYKPEMLRYYSVGKSRTTGITYSTTVIEAIGVEHKETTRNYDILAAAFTTVLKNMHDDLGLV